MTDTRQPWERTYEAIEQELKKYQAKLGDLLSEPINEANRFKLGRYSGLVDAYSMALTYLTIPIHTNRRIPPYDYNEDGA